MRVLSKETFAAINFNSPAPLAIILKFKGSASDQEWQVRNMSMLLAAAATVSYLECINHMLWLWFAILLCQLFYYLLIFIMDFLFFFRLDYFGQCFEVMPSLKC